MQNTEKRSQLMSAMADNPMLFPPKKPDNRDCPDNKMTDTDLMISAILDTCENPIFILDPNLHIVRTNRLFHLLCSNIGLQEPFTDVDLAALFPAVSADHQDEFHRIFAGSSNCSANINTAIGKCNLIPVGQAETNKYLIAVITDSKFLPSLNSGTAQTSPTPHEAFGAIIILGLDGDIMAWDRGAQVMFGWTENEAMQMNIREMLPAKIHESFLDYLEQIRSSRSERSFETEHKTKSGEIIHITITGNALQDEEGNIYAVALTEENITARILADKALQESNQRYLALSENITLGIFRLSPLGENQIIDVNTAAVNMFGFRDKNDFLIMEPHVLFYSEETGQGFLDNILQQEYFSKQEYKLRKKDGSAFWGSVTALAVRDEENHFKYHDVIIENITEKKLSLEKLKYSEKRYRELIETLGEGVIVMDREKNISLANPAAIKIFGLQNSDLTGFAFDNFLDTENLAILNKKIRNLKKDHSLNFDIEIIQPSDKKRLLMITATPRYDSDDNYIGLLGVFRDITEIRKMEVDMLQATKLESIGVLAGGIAHDFNNILTIILGNLTLAKMISDNNEKLTNRLQRAEEATNRAKDLTQQLLTFSKGGAPVKTVSSIPELLKESVNFSLIGSKVNCNLSIPDNIWPLEIDEGQISQGINNLIINATQAMPEGGNIDFSLHNIHLDADNPYSINAGKYVKISIKDQGIGIPQENLAKIFDPYFTTKKKGNGLGLSSLYSIIKKHNGAITVTSQVGAGTHFEIYLPATEKKYVGKRIQDERTLSGKGKILVMDDEKEIGEITLLMLQEMGYEVVIAQTGDSTIELYKEALKTNKPFDAVIVDLTIRGGIGGKETVRKLREIDPKVKAVVSSGYSNDPIMAHYKEYGFKGVLKKPFRPQQINDVLHLLLG